MPRGKKIIADETELKIIETENEEGTIPFFIIDDEFGIACDQYCYMLCRKKRANKTVKDEDGNPSHIESYWMWTSYRYTNSFESIMNTYVSQKERDINKKLVKEKDFKNIIKTYQDIHEIIKNAFDVEGLNKDFLSHSTLIDQRAELEADIKATKELRNKLSKECEELEKLIKEKRKIVIENSTIKKKK